MPDDPQQSPEDLEFEQQRIRFYALIGLCLTRYQNVEDYLPDVFAVSLRGDSERARAIFSVARGLEAKLNIIGGPPGCDPTPSSTLERASFAHGFSRAGEKPNRA